MNIAETTPKDNYMLYIKAEDAKAGLFDVKSYLDSEAFAPLKTRCEFEKIDNGRYFVEWASGADISGDTIKARWEILTARFGQRAAPPYFVTLRR